MGFFELFCKWIFNVSTDFIFSLKISIALQILFSSLLIYNCCCRYLRLNETNITSFSWKGKKKHANICCCNSLDRSEICIKFCLNKHNPRALWVFQPFWAEANWIHWIIITILTITSSYIHFHSFLADNATAFWLLMFKHSMIRVLLESCHGKCETVVKILSMTRKHFCKFPWILWNLVLHCSKIPGSFKLKILSQFVSSRN